MIEYEEIVITWTNNILGLFPTEGEKLYLWLKKQLTDQNEIFYRGGNSPKTNLIDFGENSKRGGKLGCYR